MALYQVNNNRVWMSRKSTFTWCRSRSTESKHSFPHRDTLENPMNREIAAMCWQDLIREITL